jgi:serine/threonine protein kinase
MTLGNFEIIAPLGAGGMGEVYSARDTRLQREVALKLLPEAFASDPERIARFEREAHTLAALNHPHIAQVYGFERGESSQALVMELVEGDDLSQLIARGRLPLDEALPIARQIADALEAAHDAGIIHRDLKPANIKVRPDGTVKVLDFGLAKALDQGSGIGSQGPGELANSPTITSPAQMTHAGMILGTAAYMSPEQARGRVLDRRTDIWAFGCVLFEMLTGTRAFSGEDVTETLAAIMKSDPPMTRLPADTPVEIRRLLTRCLQKDRRLRLQHIGDARLELDDAAHPQSISETAPSLGFARQRLAWAGLVIVAGIAGVIGGVRWGAPPPHELPEVRLDLVTPATEDPTSFALSPDGKTMAFVAAAQGGSQLHIKHLDGSPALALLGTFGCTVSVLVA